MGCFKIFWLLGIWVFISFKNVSEAYMVGSDPYHQRVHLGPRGNYVLEWKVDLPQNRVTFNVSVETRGYVGFGLSGNGKMSGADIVIGGVMPGGQVYFSDRHAVANQVPEKDPSQDWTLLEARETTTHTFLSFWRVLDTCDPQDYPITEDKISMIWAFGEKDDENGNYHYRNRGSYPVYLLHPDYSPSITHHPPIVPPVPSNFKLWTVNAVIDLPERETSYWCTMHKAPVLPRKHHVIGLDVRLDEAGTRHAHHLTFYKCNPPQGRSARTMFQSWINHRGHECFQLEDPLGPLPTEYCTQLYQNWAVGGRAIFHPPHVGVPLGTDPDEYYVLNTHFDNPNNLRGVRLNMSLDIYYTSELRRHDAGMMWVRHDNPSRPPSLLVPPSSINQNIFGMCGTTCSKKIFPPEGIHIYAMKLHSHNAGRQMKFHQFRDRRELPWILSDENYAFNYQQWRVLPREAHILPGDQLVTRCVYDSTSGNGSTVVSGHGSNQEMCTAIFFYYNKIPSYDQCFSGTDSPQVRKDILGIVGNVTWSVDTLEWMVQAPDPLAGLRITEVSDNHVDWTEERRQRLRQFQLTHSHSNHCPLEYYLIPPGDETQNQEEIMVSYPYHAKPYVPERSCSFV